MLSVFGYRVLSCRAFDTPARPRRSRLEPFRLDVPVSTSLSPGLVRRRSARRFASCLARPFAVRRWDDPQEDTTRRSSFTIGCTADPPSPAPAPERVALQVLLGGRVFFNTSPSVLTPPHVAAQDCSWLRQYGNRSSDVGFLACLPRVRLSSFSLALELCLAQRIERAPARERRE